MPFFPRLARNVLVTSQLSLLLAWVVVMGSFPLTDAQRSLLRVVFPAAAVGALLIGFVLVRWLTRPIREAVQEGADLDHVAAGVRAARVMPRRFAIAAFLAAGTSAAVAVGLSVERGMRQDLAVAGAFVGLAAAILASLLAYAVTAGAAATILRDIGTPIVQERHATVRAKILAFGMGVLTISELTFAAVSYARNYGERERDALRDVRLAQEAAISMAVAHPGPAKDVAEMVWRVTGEPTALSGPGGAFQGGFGQGADSLRPGAEAVEQDEQGWRVTRRLPGGNSIVTYLREDRLETSRAGHWRALVALVLVTYVITGVLVWVSAQAFTIPLQALGRAADRMAAGDLTGSPAIVSGDEIGRLAFDFRRMAQGLSALVVAVQEASHGVDDACRELAEIGGRVRRGALDQHSGMDVVESAVVAMQGSIGAVERAVSGLGDYARSTRSAVAEMARGLEGARGQGIELERAMAAALAEVEGLAGAGQRAREALTGLTGLAARLGESLARVDASLSALELAAVASQLNAAQAEELSDEAGEVVAETVQGIEALRAAVGDAQRRVTSLGQRAGDIDQIVDFIAEVAGRTNLLSLNASIIAAQAGEHGKAFAVVADQIRDLASQISSSTKSIGDIIRSVREDVDGTATLIARGDELAGAGVNLARRSAESLVQIRSATIQGHENAARIQEAVQGHVDSARAVARLVGSVGEGSRAVADAVERIGASVAALDRASRGVGSLADRVRRALEEEAALGQKQMQSLEGLSGMLAELDRAAGGHGEATGRVRESLQDLGSVVAQHEVAVTELAALAARLEGRTRALSERVGRFKTA
ncbi:MAG TPA: methyl-accepting chemotaxis protein [Anaeromyxobacteraceae bacterium]|nr:methyl-accepting chemotaxis protein [Anaeromyxobacteraceae bacterium]